MNNLLSYSFVFIIFMVIIIACISYFNLDYQNYGLTSGDIYISEKGFAWPIPNFYKISSYFGTRTSPTSYASTYHSGIDIPASENTYFLASISGYITFIRF